MIGHVWEWTSDWLSERQKRMHRRTAVCRKTHAAPANMRATIRPSVKGGRKFLKGGSHLCAPNYAPVDPLRAMPSLSNLHQPCSHSMRNQAAVATNISRDLGSMR